MPGKSIPAHVPERHKFCHSCLALHHVTRFYRNRSQLDGLTSQCRECAKPSGKTSRERFNPVEEVAAEMQAYSLTHPPETIVATVPPMSVPNP